MVPSMIKTQKILIQRAAKAKTPEDAAIIETQKAAINSDMQSTPAQQITLGIIAQQQRQAQMQKVNFKEIAKKLQALYNTPADMLQVQRAQLAEQEELIRKTIKSKQQEEIMKEISPKENVQDSQQEEYVDQKRLELLEKIYNSLPPKKKANFQQLLSLTQFNLPLQDYQGFANVNYDKQMRPLGKDTTKVLEF